jgi:hypothetical protein
VFGGVFTGDTGVHGCPAGCPESTPFCVFFLPHLKVLVYTSANGVRCTQVAAFTGLTVSLCSPFLYTVLGKMVYTGGPWLPLWGPGVQRPSRYGATLKSPCAAS